MFNQENVSHPVLCPLLFEGSKCEIVTVELALLAEKVMKKIHVWIVLECKEDVFLIHSLCHPDCININQKLSCSGHGDTSGLLEGERA